MLLKDSIVALITPLKKNLEIDYKSFEKLIEFQIENGSKGIVISGTTGEAATLSINEKLKLLDIAVYVSSNKIPIIFGSGNNNTKESIYLTKKAEEKGAHFILLITPYYNKPSQEGIYQHFKAIAEVTKLPICLYNVPSRTNVTINISTLMKIAKYDNIIAIKDAITDLARPLLIKNLITKDFIQLSGNDDLLIAYLASGGSGCVSVSANIIPMECQHVHDLWNNNQIKKALDLQCKFINLHSLMFCEPSPAPVKYALSLLGRCGPYVRLPIVTLSKESKLLIEEELIKLGIL